MPWFFLDVLDGIEILRDPDGQDCADLDAAIAEAAASARDLVAYALMRNEDVSGRSILVRTAGDQVIAVMPFRDALPGALRGRPLSQSGLSVQPHDCR